MLKLHVFLACEKLIVSEDGAISIITVFQGVDIQAGPDMPADAFLPASWNVLTIWGRTPESMGKKFIQKVEVVRPDGMVTHGALSEVTAAPTNQFYRSVSPLFGLPISHPGECLVKLYLKEATEEGDGPLIAEYPFIITHTKREVAHEQTEQQNAEVG